VTLSIGANPTANGVSLTGTVQPEMPGSVPHPSGTVTFLDGTTVLSGSGIALAANPSPLSQTFAQVFGTPDPQMVGLFEGELAGDFDGDGKDDLLLYGPIDTQCSVGVQLFLSSNPGQGNFRVLPRQFLDGLFLCYAPTALDVNGDGKLDLLFGDMVAYGNGDGTFSPLAVPPILASGFGQTYAVDVNGDGKLDIIGIDTPNLATDTGTAQLAFTVFRNDGSGKFTSLGTFPYGSPYQACCATWNFFALSFGDVNGDGKLDVVSESNSLSKQHYQSVAPVQFEVMLNNGDGTFGTPKPIDTSALNDLVVSPVTFGDINNDGTNDLVFTYDDNQGSSYLAAALGNGDGTFGPFFQLKLPDSEGSQVQLTDFNGDGKLDAILGSGEVALGKGDGTFALSTPLLTQGGLGQVLQMPIYAHSSPSLVFLNLTSGANAVFTPQDSSSAGTSVALSAGTHTLTVHYSGDSTYAAAVSPEVTVSVAPSATTTTVTSSANPSYVGQSVTFTATTATIAGLAPGAGGTVTFSNGSMTLGTATVSHGSASYATTFSSAGNQTITAAYGGDANDAGSSGTVDQTVEAPVTIGAGSGGSTALTVTSGQLVTAKVSVAGTAGFSGTVNFSCIGLPANAACSFNPASMAVSGTTAASTMLTVSTAAVTTANAGDDGPLRAVTVLACGLPLLGLLMLLPVARGRRLLLCLGFVLFVSATSLTGCGGGQSAQSSGTKTVPGSYTFNVVATSGAVTSTVSYSLTVQ
jgi:hypothetical protein